MKRGLLVLLGVSLLLSQSHVPVDQLRARPGAPTTGVWVFYNGAFALAELGEGISLAVVNGKPVLRATVSAPQGVVGAELAPQADGSHLLPAVSASPHHLSVYRNGVRQKQGLDYNLDPQNPRRIVPRTAWAADDVLQADFRY